MAEAPDTTADGSGTGGSGMPMALRIGGGLTALEGLTGVIAGVFILLRAVGGGHEEDFISGYGTAAWFLAIGGAVLAAGVGLVQGKRWGRGLSVIVQLLLLPVAYSLLTDSHQPFIGMIVAFLAIGTLATLFAPASMAWLTEEDLPDDSDDEH